MATESHVIITYLLDLRLQDDCCGLLNHSLCNIRLLMASRDECAVWVLTKSTEHMLHVPSFFLSSGARQVLERTR